MCKKCIYNEQCTPEEKERCTASDFEGFESAEEFVDYDFVMIKHIDKLKENK